MLTETVLPIVLGISSHRRVALLDSSLSYLMAKVTIKGSYKLNTSWCYISVGSDKQQKQHQKKTAECKHGNHRHFGSVKSPFYQKA